MKIVFFGTPEYVVPIAESLFKKFHTARQKGVVAVVTQPPKPAGRDKKLEYSPIDTWAHKRNIKILHDYDGLPEADLGVVAAYGRIIPSQVIDSFPYGILNVHPSLLPKYRGASPIQTALANGEEVTGVTVIKMDEKMDHGPIVSSFKEEIHKNDTNETLRNRLFERAASFLVELIPSYLNGKIIPKKQNHEEATFTKILKKEDGYIEDIFKNPEKTHNYFRGFHPWPGVWTTVHIPQANGEGLIEKRLKIIELHMENGSIVIDKVQLEGKNVVSFEEFKRGYSNVFSN